MNALKKKLCIMLAGLLLLVMPLQAQAKWTDYLPTICITGLAAIIVSSLVVLPYIENRIMALPDDLKLLGEAYKSKNKNDKLDVAKKEVKQNEPKPELKPETSNQLPLSNVNALAISFKQEVDEKIKRRLANITFSRPRPVVSSFGLSSNQIEGIASVQNDKRKIFDNVQYYGDVMRIYDGFEKKYKTLVASFLQAKNNNTKKQYAEQFIKKSGKQLFAKMDALEKDIDYLSKNLANLTSFPHVAEDTKYKQANKFVDDLKEIYEVMTKAVVVVKRNSFSYYESLHTKYDPILQESASLNNDTIRALVMKHKGCMASPFCECAQELNKNLDRLDQAINWFSLIIINELDATELEQMKAFRTELDKLHKAIIQHPDYRKMTSRC